MQVMAANKKKIPSAFYRLGLQYLFLNFPNIKHRLYSCCKYKQYLAGMKINHSVLHSLYKCIFDIYFFPAAPVSIQVHDNGPF